MTQELYYTASPRGGLLPGTRGLCTVAMTPGLPPPLRERLEQMSSYPGRDGPPIYSHLKLYVGSRVYHVLSRISPADIDQATKRSNFFAHHVVLEPRELPAGGPAWLALQPDFLLGRWDGEVRELSPRPVPDGLPPRSGAASWARVAGSGDWASTPVQEFLKDPRRPFYLICEPGTDPLPLVAESLALLPAPRRWEVNFSTHFTGSLMDYQWRCVPRGSEAASGARRFGYLDLAELRHQTPLKGPGPAPEARETGADANMPALPPPVRLRGPDPQVAIVEPVALTEAPAQLERQRRERPPSRRGWLRVAALVFLVLTATGAGAAGGFMLAGRTPPVAEAQPADLAPPPQDRLPGFRKALETGLAGEKYDDLRTALLAALDDPGHELKGLAEALARGQTPPFTEAGASLASFKKAVEEGLKDRNFDGLRTALAAGLDNPRNIEKLKTAWLDRGFQTSTQEMLKNLVREELDGEVHKPIRDAMIMVLDHKPEGIQQIKKHLDDAANTAAQADDRVRKLRSVWEYLDQYYQGKLAGTHSFNKIPMKDTITPLTALRHVTEYELIAIPPYSNQSPYDVTVTKSEGDLLSAEIKLTDQSIKLGDFTRRDVTTEEMKNKNQVKNEIAFVPVAKLPLEIIGKYNFLLRLRHSQGFDDWRVTLFTKPN